MVVLDTATATFFKNTMQEFAHDVHREMHTDTYTLWKRERPAGGWDDGDESERWEKIGEGTGKLSPNGAGGPQAMEGVLFPDSPYRFRTLATAFDALPHVEGKSEPDVTHCVLVVNGERLFQVDAFKQGAKRRVNATAYLREIFDAELPTEVLP